MASCGASCRPRVPPLPGSMPNHRVGSDTRIKWYAAVRTLGVPMYQQKKMVVNTPAGTIPGYPESTYTRVPPEYIHPGTQRVLTPRYPQSTYTRVPSEYPGTPRAIYPGTLRVYIPGYPPQSTYTRVPSEFTYPGTPRVYIPG